MLNNEQRAHDMAIAMLPYIVNAQAGGFTDSYVVRMYNDTYSAYLQYLNEQDDEEDAPAFEW